MTEIRNRLPSALVCSLTGGWSPGESQSPKVNKVIHTYLWFHFAVVPIVFSALLGRTESIWIITGVSFSSVFIFKYLCYLFSRVLNESTPQTLETSSVPPVWVAIHDKFIGSKKSKSRSTALSKRLYSPSRPTGNSGRSGTTRSQNSGSFDNITYASWNLANEPTGSAATTVDGTLITQTAGLCLIRENPEVEGVADRQFERKPKISRPGSVDYGINKETPTKRRSKRSKMESQSEPEDHENARANTEIEPLLLNPEQGEPSTSTSKPVDGVPIEANTKIIHRQRPSRKSIRRHVPKAQQNPQNTQVVTSASCTIRKEASGSDPERLSVSDAKLQAGEMLPNLSNSRPYNGRRGRLNTLKSVLSESSVVDVTNYDNEKIDSPKSAEDISEEVCNILRAKRKDQEQNQSEAGSSTQEGLSTIQRIDNGSPFPEKADSLSSSTGTNKRPDSPIIPMELATTIANQVAMSSRNQIVGSQMTLDGLDQRSNRSSSLRSRRTFGTGPASRSDTPTPFQVQGLFNFRRNSQRSASGAPPPNLDLPEGFTESPSNQMATSEIMQMLNRAERAQLTYSALDRLPMTTGSVTQRVLRRRERKIKYDQKKYFVRKFARKKWTYYKFNLFGIPALPVKIFYTKQDLSNLLDISTSFSNVLVSAITCGLISLLASYLLTLQRPIAIARYPEQSFIFSKWILYLVAATCQYSTIKSPIPDVMSPGHGYAFSVAFARPIYFILSSLLTIMLVLVSHSLKLEGGTTLYGCFFVDIKFLAICIEISKLMTYLMPVLFMLGFYARLITFLNWTMESVEITFFGGTGSSSLKDSITVLLRSVGCVVPVVVLNFFSMKNKGELDNRIFSISSALCLTLAYVISRASNGNPHYDLLALKRIFGLKKNEDKISSLDKKIVTSAHHRLESSILNGCIIFIIACLLGIANVFVELKSMKKVVLGPLEISVFNLVILAILSVTGFLCDYLLPRVRSQNPWIIFKHPVLRTPEYKKFEVNSAAAVMWFDKFQFFMTILIKNLLLPIAFMNEFWSAADSSYFENWSIFGKSIFLAIISFSISRRFFRDCEYQWLILMCSYLLVFDLQKYDIKEPILVTWFLGNIVASKVLGLYRRLCFIYVHIMPCASTWGSAFHAISQPICMPHSGWMYLQAVISTITSAPIKPLGGASVFLTSYVRPLRFWEKTFQTKTAGDERLQSQLESHRRRNENAQRNSIFYENLAISVRNQLAGDIALGRFGNVKEGDVFILASKSTATSLNGLLQIVELGNGVVSFQLRGLEFKGTYCQQREVEAITEDEPPATQNHLCFARSMCCLRSQKWVYGLSAFFKNLLMTWRVVQKNYVMPGYSICDSSTDFLGMYDYRKLVKTSFTRCIIYFAAKYERLDELLDPKNELIKTLNRENYDSDFEVVTSVAFSHNTDVDYDLAQAGVSKVQFLLHYSHWANHCFSMTHPEETECPTNFLTLVFALSIVGRKAISNASQAGNTADATIFLNGLYQMFQGNIMPDFSDEWVFTNDMALLNEIVAPALRLAIKLQSDELRKLTVGEASSELTFSKLWKEIETARKTVICHENDPKWREAVLNNEPELFSFRHIVTEDESSDYRLMMLVRRQLSFKIIKINSESVRGNWAAQQEELVFVRNQNPERGSIQNARAILRNIINSSCDQPIGYPSYVSPILTSYTSTHDAVKELAGDEVSFTGIYEGTLRFIGDCLLSCISCNSGIGLPENVPLSSVIRTSTTEQNQAAQTWVGTIPSTPGENVAQNNLDGSVSSLDTLSSLSDHDLHRTAIINDTNQVLSNLDGFRRGGPQFVHWEKTEWRNCGGARSWGDWRPKNGMKGVIVWGWYPCHRLPAKRSHIHTAILLLKIEENSKTHYVPIQKPGIMYDSDDSSAVSSNADSGESEDEN